MRSSRLFAVLAVFAAGFLTTGFKTVNYMDGNDVMAKVKDTHGAEAEIDVVKLVTVVGTNDPVTRTLISCVQKGPDGNLRYLLRVLSPEDDKGISLLVLEKTGGDVDQYLYIPALGPPKKITPEGRSGSFMGSDFTYEDLRKEKPGEWTYSRLEDEKVDDTDCYVILSDPANKDREKITGYTDRLVYVDKTTYDIRRIQFYDSKHKLIKEFDAYDYEKTNSDTQRPKRGEMKNDTKKSNTVMALLSSRLNQPLDEKFFSLDTLQHWGPDQDKLVQDLVPKQPANTP
jgi:hypothetical protein